MASEDSHLSPLRSDLLLRLQLDASRNDFRGWLSHSDTSRTRYRKSNLQLLRF